MASSDLSRFLTENEDNFETMDCGACLMRLAEGMDCSKAELARRSGMSTVYLYQVFSGRRKPSRDRLISLCFGLITHMMRQHIRKSHHCRWYDYRIIDDSRQRNGIRNQIDWTNQIKDCRQQKPLHILWRIPMLQGHQHYQQIISE
jgi:transcriptional regulator with XRE-family HTH domain